MEFLIRLLALDWPLVLALLMTALIGRWPLDWPLALALLMTALIGRWPQKNKYWR